MWYKVSNGHHWGDGPGRVDGPGLIEINDDVNVDLFIPWKLTPVESPQVERLRFGDGVAGDGVADDDVFGDLSDGIAERLEAAGVTPEDLIGMTDDDILAIKGIGATALAKIREHYPAGGVM